MVLVKKCQFFLYLVLVKTRLWITFNNVVDRRETCFEYKKEIFQVPKMVFLQRGSPMLLVKKCQFFLFLFLVKTRLEKRFNSVLVRKETFLDWKKNSKSPKNRIFPKGLTHGFGQKMPILSLFGFGQNKTINNV